MGRSAKKASSITGFLVNTGINPSLPVRRQASQLIWPG